MPVAQGKRARIARMPVPVQLGLPVGLNPGCKLATCRAALNYKLAAGRAALNYKLAAGRAALNYKLATGRAGLNYKLAAGSLAAPWPPPDTKVYKKLPKTPCQSHTCCSIVELCLL
ncbi:hypothetical protein [Kamptonema formosum]|uniref:hypothetical protein n=1 Tax=Kamptonema formosum TaxID=331992 RepID=UPI0003470C74|nr:hypothetical protein [Oscillatoria sp. PCC 10802]